MSKSGFQMVQGQRTGEVTLVFAHVALHVHYPHDDGAHNKVMGMIAAAPQDDPYHMLAALLHDPVSSAGTELRQPQVR